MVQAVDTTSDNVSKEAREAQESVRFFLNELRAARKREKHFRDEGKRILDLYEQEKKNPFAMLFSNTETMLPALYSAVPRAVVQRRFKDEDQLGKLAAQAGQRALEFMLDSNIDGYETYDEAMRSAVLTGLLPGRGVTCVKYDSEVVDVKEGERSTPYKNYETVCPDSFPWDRFLHGYAKKWSKVPWVAYELHIDADEAKKLGITDAVIALIKFTKGEDAPESDEETKQSDSEDNVGERETALIYQIWDKDGGRKVRYLCPQYKEDFCAVQDDPLKLTGFFNCPRPVQFVEKVHDLTPVPLYAMYETQAEEVNNLTTRINALIKQIKARGAYDTELGDDIKRILDSEEGDLVAADKSSSLAAEKGLQNAIWMWPVEKLIVVLRELYNAREQAKRVIYEITGVSDIIRGSTVASETATAQELKSEFGKLRLKRPQKEVQRYARDMLRMMLEIAAEKFSERTWAQMTGLPFVTTEEFQATQNIAAAMAQKGMPVDAQTQAKLQMPKWADVLKLLRDDIQRAYRVDIETNSTVEAEATEDQKMIAEVMNALAQYLNGVAPLVQSGALPFEAAQAMMLAIVRRFRFGPEIEDYVKAMKPPTPPDDGKGAEQEKLKVEAADKERQAALKDKELGMTDAREREKMQLEDQREREKLAREDARENQRIAHENEHKHADRQVEREKTAAGAMVKREEIGARTQSERETRAAKKEEVAANTAGKKQEKDVANTAKQANEVLVKAMAGFAALLETFQGSMQELQKTLGPMAQLADSLSQSAQSQEKTAQSLAQALMADRELIYKDGEPVGSRVKRTMQ